MNELLVGYARVSTEQQDLTAQRNGLHALGVGDDRIYVDHGLSGTNRDRPGLRLALAACRAGDTLVVTKLDRLARSLPDARDILDELTRRSVKLSLGGSIHDPTDPVGRLLFNVLAMVAEFESDLIRLRTREGMKVAKAKGRLRGKQPKLKPNQRNTCSNCTTVGTTPKPSSPNSSASDDQLSTARSTECEPSQLSPSGRSPTSWCRGLRTPKSALRGTLSRAPNATVSRCGRSCGIGARSPNLSRASSSGTASLEGGNSCCMFHCQEMIRRTGAASGTVSGTGEH
jgi:hypothetical protein